MKANAVDALRKRVWWRCCAVMLGLLALPACGTQIPNVEGRVADLVTGEPIADVDVIVLYFGEASDLQKLMRGGPFHHYIPGCGANRITKTDANGRWQVDSFKLGVDAHDLRYSILLYKDGYREGSPGRDKNTMIEMKLTANKDLYEYDSSYPYKKKRDYTGVVKGWGSIEKFQKTWLTPNAYLADNILGSDNDHQYLFIGCAEKGKDDPALNAFAQKFILQWLDTVPTENLADYRNACERTASYVRLHPEFLSELHATQMRSRSLKSICKKTYLGDGYFDEVLGIK